MVPPKGVQSVGLVVAPRHVPRSVIEAGIPGFVILTSKLAEVGDAIASVTVTVGLMLVTQVPVVSLQVAVATHCEDT